MAFRDYLKTVDPYAYEYTGNDAKIDYTKVGKGGDTARFSTTDPNRIQSYITGLYNDYQKTQTPTNIGSIYGSGGGAPQVYAPRLDIAAVNAQARQAAEGAVNPYYTKTLNDFLTQQAAQRQQQQTLYETNIKNIEDTLAQTQEQNALNKERTTADVALNQEQINTQNDENQIDTGKQFEDARLAQARDLATAGVLGSGVGNRQSGATTANRNTQEGRQNAAFQTQRNQQELFKTRTFEDLAKSDEFAGKSAGKAKAAQKFDLDSYIQNAGFTEQNKRNELEAQRLQAVQGEQGNQSKLLFNNYLAGISDPAKYQAALQTYGGSF